MENKQTLLGRKRTVECMWGIQEKFPVRTMETTEKGTEKGMRGDTHRSENAELHESVYLFPFVLSPSLHKRVCSGTAQ